MVFGNMSPCSLNSELSICAEEIVTGPFEAARVNCRLAEDPTVTLPKFALEGDNLRLAPAAFVP